MYTYILLYHIVINIYLITAVFIVATDLFNSISFAPSGATHNSDSRAQPSPASATISLPAPRHRCVCAYKFELELVLLKAFFLAKSNREFSLFFIEVVCQYCEKAGGDSDQELESALLRGNAKTDVLYLGA